VIKVNWRRNGRNGRLFSRRNDRNDRLKRLNNRLNNGDRLYNGDRLNDRDIRLCNIMCYLENTWLLYRWRRRR
jgi:hypothetical protein